ncbi:PAAR domain-containing protein [Aerolutibacter ruishenii]|uniref:PAAR domain-containing protein n=1 Tax=Aerolutibacter ruishenii TaxID=686800 RepID=UPI0011A8CBC2|nr:PAAR domain-containing protein [Lysobacter ruishenii]
MWVVLGDSTSSGGKVVTGSPFTDIDGMSVARVSDKATCLLHKGVFPIVDGDSTTIIDGQPVALHGSRLACGCSVLAVQQVRVYVDGGGARAANSGPSTQTESSPHVVEKLFHEQYRAVDIASGEPVANMAYRIDREDGTFVTGLTGADGLTGRVSTSQPERVRLTWLSVSSDQVGVPELHATEGC